MTPDTPIMTLHTNSPYTHFVWPIAKQNISSGGVPLPGAAIYLLDMIPDAGSNIRLTMTGSPVRLTDLLGASELAFYVSYRNKSNGVWTTSTFTSGSGAPSPYALFSQVINFATSTSYDALSFNFIGDQVTDLEWDFSFTLNVINSGLIAIPDFSRHTIDCPFTCVTSGNFSGQSPISGSSWLQNTSSDLNNGGSTGACYNMPGFTVGTWGGTDLVASLSQVPGAMTGKVKNGLYGWEVPKFQDHFIAPFTKYNFTNGLCFIASVPDTTVASMQFMTTRTWAFTSYDQNWHFTQPIHFEGYSELLDCLRRTARVMDNASHVSIINNALKGIKKVIDNEIVSKIVSDGAKVAEKINSKVNYPGNKVASAALKGTRKTADANIRRIQKKNGTEKPPPLPPRPKRLKGKSTSR